MAETGALRYQSLIDAGAPQAEADAWKERQKETMRAAGAPQPEIDHYWGDAEPDMAPVHNLAAIDQVRRNQARPATNLVEDFVGAWQRSNVGLTYNQKLPMFTPRNSTLASAIVSGIGQLGGDLPTMIGAGALTSESGPIVAGAATFAAPEAYRQVMVDYLTHKNDVRSPSYNEVWERISAGTWETAKAGLIGGISVPVGGAIGGAVLRATGSRALGSAADVTAMTAAATAAGGALEGHWPEPHDWAAGMVLALGMHAAISTVGATQRWEPTKAGETVGANMQQIYARTGVPPWKQGTSAASDPEFRSEVFSHDVNQEPVAPKFTAAAPTEVGKPELPAPSEKPLPYDIRRHEDLELVRALENSGDDAVSPAGAIGRYQIMPNTAKQYGYDPTKLTDPAYNEKVAVTIIDDLNKRYDMIADPAARRAAVLIAYNAGPGRADAWFAHGMNDKMLPAETQKYLNRAQRAGAFEHDVQPPILNEEHVPPGEEPHGIAPGMGVDWNAFKEEASAAGSVTRIERDPEGGITFSADPDSIAYYLRDFGKLAGFHFTVSSEKANGHAASIKGTEGPHYFDKFKNVHIPDTPQELSRRWYGLGRYEILFHEVGHALDYNVLRASRELKMSLEQADKLKKELEEFSHLFRPVLWKDYAGHLSKFSELMADATAVYLSRPDLRPKMTQFTKLFGAKLAPYLKMAEQALPIRSEGGGWTHPNEPGYGAAEGAGGGGKKPPPPPGSPPPEFKGPPPPKPKLTTSRIKLNADMLSQKALDIIGTPEPTSYLDRGKALVETAYNQYISELGPAKRFDAHLVKEGKSTENTFGIEDAFRSTYASAEYAGHFLRHGIIDANTRAKLGNESYIGSYELAKRMGGNEAGFTAYRLAKRQLEKEEQGIDVGATITHDEAVRIVSEGADKYRKADEMINRVKNGALDYAKDSGLYSAERIQAIKKYNKSHIPFRRVQAPGEETVLRPGRRFRARQPLKEMTGSDRKIVEPVYADIENMHTLIAMADRNRAVRAILETQDGPALMGLKMIEKHPKVTIFGPDGKEIKPGNNGGAALEDFDTQMQVKLDLEKRLGKNDFIYYNEGRPEIWTAKDPDLAAMIRGATKVDEGMIFGVAKWFTSVKRAGIIDMPDYIAKMIIKDQFTTPVIDKHGGVPFQNFMIGIWTALGNKPKWEEFVRNGGMGAALASMDAKYVRRDVEAVFKKTDVWTKVINYVRDPIDANRIFMERMDAMSRLGRYVRRTASGKVTNFKAGMESRKVYLDFQERGASSHLNDLAKIDAFLRPTILSWDQFGHAVKTDPVGVAYRGLAFIGVPSAVIFYLNWKWDQGKDADDPTRYNNLDRWTRDNYFVLPDYMGEHIKFPRAQGQYGLIFGGLMDRFLETQAQQDPGKFSEWGEKLVGTFVPNVIPDVGYPMAEQLSGQSLFMGRPLISSSLAEANGPMQYTPNTTEIAKQVAKLLPSVQVEGVGLPLNSPIVLENYVRDWAGTGGINLLRALNTPFSKNNAPTQLADIPFVASFFIRHESANLEPITNFYDAFKQVKMANRDKFLALERGQVSGDFSEFESVGENAEAFLNIQSVSTALNNMQNAINGINQDAEMKPAEKRQFIDDILRTMITTSRTGSEIIGAINDQTIPQ